MSDTTACPFDSVIATLRERETDLLAQSMKIDERLAECREMIMLVSSKRPKAPRKPRSSAVPSYIDGDGVAHLSGEDPSSRPTVFATPSSGEPAEVL